MKKGLSLFSAALFFCSAISAQLKVQNLLTENRTNPIGLDMPDPGFSWQLTGDQRDIRQTAYEIRIRSDGSTVWNSGKVLSDQSVHIPYTGTTLRSDKKYDWQTRVWDNKGKHSAWSATASWQTGLFKRSDWIAQWIQPGDTESATDRPSPIFRKEFSSTKELLSATIYITAHGLYEARLNGQRIGDAYLTPGWTDYQKRLQYQVYDVTAMIRKGKNAIGVTLGSGWYRGYIAYQGHHDVYGTDASLLCQLMLHYSDGSTLTIVSDGTWRSSTGAIQSSEIYNGEIVDAGRRKDGWDQAGYDDSHWNPVRTAVFPFDNLIATENEPVRKHETFSPLKILTTLRGEKVIDFGQNLVGWVMVTARGKAGDRITISHAEVLDKTGNFYTDNLRAARAQDTYILKGSGEEHFEPHFTFHGFRYIKIEGYPGEIRAQDFTAVALYSDMPATGNFSCSNPLINQLQHNIQWGQRGNFLDIPTDCPQRDERLGWTGDAQVFSRTAAFNRNVEDFFSKWMKDVAADQFANGSVPFVVPNVLGAGAGGSAGWADVATVIPWNMYLAYGDRRILKQQYPSMKAWVGYMTAKSMDNLWNTGYHFGDWLFYRPDDDNDGKAAVTDKYLIAQCFYAHSTQLLIDAARILNKPDDSAFYSTLLDKIKTAFLKEYLTPNGRLVSGTQTAYVLALDFDMLPDSLREQAAQRLVDNIKSYGNHLTTGFLGTPYICETLTRFGHEDMAYALLLQDTYPSWLYPVKMGATTVWERWDGIKPDSSFETPSMNSFNHYSYGAIGDWMYRSVAGIDTYEDGPGYKHIRIMPHPGGGLHYANADLETYYGTVSAHWKIDSGKLELDVIIPANSSATIYLPAPSIDSISENGRPLPFSSGIRSLAAISEGKKKYIVAETGSGSYHFSL